MFIVLPVGMNYETRRLPIVTFSLIGLNVLVHLIVSITGANADRESMGWVFENLWLVPSLHHWWAYLTSMFVHEGFLHLFGNMIFLFLFGCCVEDLVGRARFIFMYLVGGLIATLTFILISPDRFASDTPLGGASGAISACMGMYLILRASARIDFRYFYFWLIGGAGAGDFELPAWVAISCWFAKDVVMMIIGTMDHRHRGGVAFGAHVGGLLGGIGLAILHKLTARPEEEVEEEDLSGNVLQPAFVPVAGATEVATIFIYANGRQSGPFTLQQVRVMIQLRNVGADAFYWTQGLSGWHPVTELTD